MHLLYLFVLFAIPSLLLAEKCVWRFMNPRTKSLETVWTCCMGYTKGTGGNCEPICINPCGNGKCVSPNLCTCDPGYRNLENKESQRCVPYSE